MLAGLCLCAALSAASAQPASEPARAELVAAPVVFTPIREGGVRKNRGISIPPNLRLAPERRVSVGYTASNSYLNPGLLVCESRDCQLGYATDHTGNLLYLELSQPVLGAWEFGAGIGAYRMHEIPDVSPVHRLASDRALRIFHDDVLGEPSLPARSDAPDGRQLFSLGDFDGRRLVLDGEHAYALPLRLDLTRYFAFRPTPRSRLGLNLGLHLSWPLEGEPGSRRGTAAFSRGADFGIALNLVRSRQVTANVSTTYHLQLARFRSDIRVVNPESPLNGDDGMRSFYALGFGLRFAGSFAGKAPCSFMLSQLTSSAHYDRAAHYAYDPQLFEGGTNLRSALASANDYGVLSFGCEFRRRHLQLAVVEDLGGLSQLVGDDGAGASYDPDFAVSVSVSWRLGARRRAAGD